MKQANNNVFKNYSTCFSRGKWLFLDTETLIFINVFSSRNTCSYCYFTSFLYYLGD